MTESRMPENLDALLRTLREQGVERARREGEEILAEARGRAAAIVQQAERTAAELLEQDRRQRETEAAAAHAALARAARDVLLAARADLLTRMQGLLRARCAAALDAAGLRDLILRLASAWSREGHAQPVELLIGPEDLARLGDTALDQLRQQLTGGLVVRVQPGARDGIRLRSGSTGVEIETGETALTEAFLHVVGPRFAGLFDAWRGPAPS